MTPPTARQLARAIGETYRRYLAGMMSRAAWKSHTLSLWDRAAALGVEERVRKLLMKGAQR